MFIVKNSQDVLDIVKERCIVYSQKSQYTDGEKLYVFKTDKTHTKLPLGLWSEFLDDHPNEKYLPKCELSSPTQFTSKLFTAQTDPQHRNRDQTTVAREAIHHLNNLGCVFLSLHTGFGKTLLGVYLFTKLKVKCVVLTHLSILHEQWAQAFKANTTNTTISINNFNNECDVNILGVTKCSHYTLETFKNVGLVIIDEAHICTVTAFTNALFHFRPRYMIGLSATPDRVDGLHNLFELFFGETMISRFEKKEFNVYKYKTNFKVNVKYIMVRGVSVPNWCSIIADIETCEERWKYIADITTKYPKNTILILSNRNVQTLGIYNELVSRNESVDYLCGNKKKYDKTRVLVAGMKKSGVGFDDSRFDMIILASDCKDVRQFEGRVRTTNNIIVDIVDNFRSFESHWKIRKEWYISRGATIHDDAPVKNTHDIHIPNHKLM